MYLNLNLKGLTKNGNAAIYTGAAGVVRIAVTAFPGKVPCDSIGVLNGCLEPAKQPKYKMTKEERKAANAAKPKPTLAEKIAKDEARLARLKAKAGQ